MGANAMLETSRQVVADLADRVRTHRIVDDGDAAGFTPLIDVVGDVGRALAHPERHDFVAFLPDVASLREGLEEENDDHFSAVARTPLQALKAPKLSAAYAAGALWALSTIVDAVLDAGERGRALAEARTTRADVRAAIRDLVRTTECIRPSDVRTRLASEGRQVDAATISRAFSDLLQSGEIQGVSTGGKGDRRSRYYTAVRDEAPAVAHDQRLELRRWLIDRQREAGVDRVLQVLEEEVSLLRASTGGRPQAEVAAGA